MAPITLVREWYSPPRRNDSKSMNSQQIASTVNDLWDRSALPALENYIRIPNQSPLYDPQWKGNGHMQRAVVLARQWVEQQQVTGLRAEVHEVDGRTPLLFIEIDGDPASTVLMYGHLDKQTPIKLVGGNFVNS